MSPVFGKATKENHPPNPASDKPNKSEIPEESLQQEVPGEEGHEEVEDSQAPEEHVEAA